MDEQIKLQIVGEKEEAMLVGTGQNLSSESVRPRSPCSSAPPVAPKLENPVQSEPALL